MDYKKEDDYNIIVSDNTDVVSNSFHDSTTANFKTDLCADISSAYVPVTLKEIEFQIDRLKRRWNEFTYLIGQRLKFINKNKLYEQKGYTDFSTYVRTALKMSDNNAYYYIAVFDYFTEEQTQTAGSKLKLIIPVLNKVKKDKTIPEELKTDKIADLKSILYKEIKNKTYREAERIIKNMKRKFFITFEDDKQVDKIVVKKDRIIIYEDDKDNRDRLLKIINRFYYP